MRRLAVLLAPLLLPACGPGAAGDGRAEVVAAFYPLAWAAEEVAAGSAEVVNLTPPGAEPHDLELSPGQVRTVIESDLLLYVGGGFQPALEEIAADHDAAVDVLAAVAGDDHEVGGGGGEGSEQLHEGEAGGGEHAHEGDPHVWLDPLLMVEVVEVVGARIAEVAPGSAAVARRADAVARDLVRLHEDFAGGLERCERREIVVSHDAFGYLAARYDLEQIPISGLDPEAEPSPQRVAEVARLAERRGATTVFFESLVSPAIAETIAAEVGVETAVLDPLEGAPERGDYLDAMRANLEELREALGCR